MKLEEIKERMHSGKLYFCNDEELLREQTKRFDMLQDYNKTRASDYDERVRLLKEGFAEFGDNSYIEIPFHANWFGKFTHIGKNFYSNFNLTLVDDGEIYIGDNVMIGPNVTIATATHPVHPKLRSMQAQYNLPVTLGYNVWIGANVTVLPGVKIGDNSIIGAGSVVTKDIKENCIAYGNPCKVVREINESDLQYYNHNMKIDISCEEQSKDEEKTTNKNCPCTRNCPRHGNCDECHEHQKNKKSSPWCERTNKRLIKRKRDR